MSLLALAMYAVALPLTGTHALQDPNAGGAEQSRSVIYGAVYWLGEHKSKGIPVYLFDLQQSAPLRHLVRSTQRRLRSIGQGNARTVNLEIEFFDKVAELVPRLPSTAKTRSNEAGTFKLSEVPSGKRYYVVSVDITEDGVFYGATLTPTLKPGQQLQIEVRRINLWYPQ
jgi:hypothetical protein